MYFNFIRKVLFNLAWYLSTNLYNKFVDVTIYRYAQWPNIINPYIIQVEVQGLDDLVHEGARQKPTFLHMLLK